MACADHLVALRASDPDVERERRLAAFHAAEAKLNRTASLQGRESWEPQAGAAQPKVLWLAALTSAGAPAWFLDRLRALPALLANARRVSAAPISSQTDVTEGFYACSALRASCEATGNALLLCLQPLRSLDPVQDWPVISQYGAPFLEPDFMQALSQAASSLAAAPGTPGPARAAEFSKAAASSCALVALVAGAHLRWVTGIISDHVDKALGGGPPGWASAASPAAATASLLIPEPVACLPGVLRDSELLAATARATLACPGPDFVLLPGQSPHGRNAARADAAAAEAAAAAAAGVRVRPKFQPCCFAAVVALLVRLVRRLEASFPPLWAPLPPGVQALGRALGEALDHRDVAALRLAMLETVWEQAGMGRAGGDTQPTAESAEVEGDGGVNLVVLWEHVEHVVTAALGLWQEAATRVLQMPGGCRLPPERGVRPALQLARTAARTAEALCRLHGGQGLGGVYAPSVWRSLRVDVAGLRASLLPLDQPAQPLRLAPEAAHWAEAGAFLLPLACDALEAALEQPKQPPPSRAMTFVPEELLRVEDMKRCMEALWTPAEAWPGGQGPEDLRCRLRRADLGASLDHALRLAFTAADRISSVRAAGREVSPHDLMLESHLNPFPEFVARAVRHLGLPALSRVEVDGGSGGGSSVGGGSVGGGGGGSGELVLGDAGGVVLTCAKRALALALRVEGLGQAGPPRTGAQPPPTPDALGPLLAVLADRAPHLSWHHESVLARSGAAAARVPSERRSAASGGRTRPAAADQQASGPSSGGDGGGGVIAAELEAYVMQATGRLAAAAVAHPSVLDQTDAPDAESVRSRAWAAALEGLCVSLGHVSALCGTPGSCPPGLAHARLLACQPHRLLFAGCKLLCAWRYSVDRAAARGVAVPQDTAPELELAHSLVLALARAGAHPAECACARRWLLPPRPAGTGLGAEADAGGVGEAGAEAAGSEERGCLEAAWGAAMGGCLQAGRKMRQLAAVGLALLRAAQDGGGDGGGGGSGGEEAGGGGADATFSRAAAVLAKCAAGCNPAAPGANTSRLPPLPLESLQGLGPANAPAMGAAGPQRTEEVLQAPLPPPVAVPPAGHLRARLRVCGFPGCVTYAGRGEADLQLKQCGGCKAVRYCGPGCQRAHWREGHKGECGALAAAVTALAAARESE